jgi:hypothetical protein
LLGPYDNPCLNDQWPITDPSEMVRHIIVHRVDPVPEILEGREGRDRDQGGDQCIFDRIRAAFASDNPLYRPHRPLLG